MREICASCDVLLSMRNICARFLPNVQYMNKIFARLVTYFPNAQHMCKICARLYFFPQYARLYLFPQCAVYGQDLRKIVLIPQYMCKFAQDCTFPQCAIYAQDLHKITFRPSMCKMCARLYVFPLFDLFFPTSHASKVNLFKLI